MALGHLLWVSWICLLLFNSAAGVLTRRGYAHPHKHDSRNLFDEKEEEDLETSLMFDDADPTYGQSPDTAYGGYNQPSDAEKLDSGQSEDWSDALVFPLNPGYQSEDPARPPLQPVQPELSFDASKEMTSPGTGGAAYNGPAVPASTSQAENVYPQPGSDHRDPGQSGSGMTAGDPPRVPHLVYEEVFQYPSSTEETANVNPAGDKTQAPPSQPLVPNYRPAVGVKPVSRPGKPVSRPGKPVSRPAKGSSPTGKKMTSTKLKTYSVRYEPANAKRPRRVMTSKYPVQPRRTSYIVQSRGGYQRKKTILSRTMYSPDLYDSRPVSTSTRRKPAAPKVAWLPPSRKE